MCGVVQKFRVIKIDSDVFTLDKNGERLDCRARKSVKKSADIRVGDWVCIDTAGEAGEPVIMGVERRKNSLIRPAVANVDMVVVVVAPSPVPDFLMVDKLIVNCRAAGIRTAVCLNKNDLEYDFEPVAAQYRAFADAVVSVSAANRVLDPLRELLAGRLTALAGQSAVGKSSIVNALTGLTREVGGVSEKIGRGRNTTTRAEIIPLGGGAYIVDTPGFSMLDVHETSAEELADCYGYTPYASACRFGGRCTHTVEPGCAVRQAAAEGGLNAQRYERYVALYGTVRKSKKYGRRSIE